MDIKLRENSSKSLILLNQDLQLSPIARKKPSVGIYSFDEIHDVSCVISGRSDDWDVQNDNLKGIPWMILSLVGFSCASIVCKIAYMRNDYLNGIDYAIWRSIIMVTWSMIQVWATRVNVLEVKKGYRLLLVARCIVGTIGMPWYFIAIKYIPLSLWTLIASISPLMIGILAYLLLGEAITRLKVLAVIGAFVGVYILTLHKDENYQKGEHYTLGIILVSCTCMAITFVALLTRVLNKGIHYILSPFWFSMTTLGWTLSLLCVYPSAYHFDHMGYTDVGLFFFSGLFTYAGQIFKSLAFRYSEASQVAPLQYFDLIFLLLSDIFIFNAKFTSTDGIGGLLILVSLLAPIFQSVYLRYSTSRSLSF